MAKSAGLNALKLKTLTRSGLHADGRGLYMQISRSGTRSWIFRYQVAGRRRLMGLGPVGPVTLTEARELAHEAKRAVARGIDPINARQSQRAAARVGAAKTVTFQNAAERYIAAHRAGWSPKHIDQWASSLAGHVYPKLAALPISSIDLRLVIQVVEPLWTIKPETASRVRGRIEAILDWATARGYRTGDNPARWRGNLKSLLPARSKIARVEHLAALPYREIGSLMIELRQRDSIPARALEFLILTAARSAEVLGACWNEFDLEERLWTVPANRMKADREHRVPLSDAALDIIKNMATSRCSDFVFPGAISGRARSQVALRMVLRELGRTGLTVHGFRSSFADWATERTNYPGDAIELALAHRVGDTVVAAYRRSDAFDRRRRLMEDWAKHCAMPSMTSGKVVSIR